jgi:hypothetical protein
MKKYIDAKKVGYSRRELLTYRRKLERLEMVLFGLLIIACIIAGYFLGLLIFQNLKLSGIVKVGQNRPEVAQLYPEIKFSWKKWYFLTDFTAPEQLKKYDTKTKRNKYIQPDTRAVLGTR